MKNLLRVATSYGKILFSFEKVYKLVHFNGKREKKNISGKENIVEILLQSGARINDADENRKTALHLAVEYGQIEIAKILIDSCASLNPKDETMRTPLHHSYSE